MTVDGPRRRVRRDRSPRYSPPDAYGHHHDQHHHDHDSAKHEHENGQQYPPSPQPPYPIDTDPELPPDYHTKLNSHSVFSPDFHGGPEKREVSPGPKKRIIVCCDGTWMNSDRGYVKSGMFGGKDTLQVPSNVTRISRCFKRTCHDGTLQIVNYESGVGTGLFDSITGGAFGMGISERVSEAYTYICANYHSGDEIILVGFSRGAFTARSVAGMVSNLGLLTLKGLDYYYPIFRDMQHWGDDDYKDPFPDMPFSDKPTTEEPYRDKLEKMGLTRVRQHNGQLIKIKAICVWDTVGSLGIPRMAWMDTVGFRTPFYEEFKWHDTALSDRIEHAFQALALDETRPPFSPAVWERLDENRSTTDLRQVWFPGNHGNIGGGWDDQGIANLTLAWMMDQMASVGVEFSRPALDRIFIKSVDYYEKLGEHGVLTRPSMKHTTKQWAVNPIYEMNDPVRPWGLGAIRSTSNLIYRLSGSTDRTPGQYKATDMRTGLHTRKFLQDTNERVHSSVRIRLRLKGLNLNDEGVWTCPALSNWRLRRTNSCFDDPVPRFPHWAPNSEDQTPTPDPNSTSAGRWVWEYVGPESEAPTDWRARVLVEEPLGPYERYLLKLSGGHPNVYEYAMKLEQDLEMQRNNRKGRKKRYQGETESRRHSHLM